MVANEKPSRGSNGDACVNSEPCESVSLLKKIKSRYSGNKNTESIVVNKNQPSRTIKERSGISQVEIKAKMSTSNSNSREKGDDDNDDFASIKERVINATRTQQVVSASSQSSNQESISSSNQSSICLLGQPTKQVANNKKAQKPRRRVATLAQRRAANIRERRRMFNLNAAFDRLRKKVPSFAYEKRLSRIETLKLAIMYIRFMDDLVNNDAYAEKYKQLTANSSSLSVATGFLSSSSYLSLYGHCKSPSPIPPVNQGHNNLKQALADESHTNQTSQITNFATDYNVTTATSTKLRRDETRRSLIKMEGLTDIRQHSSSSSSSSSERSNQIVQINSTAFNCNENHQCLLNQSCLAAQQYRVPTNQLQVASPGNSAGVCCSSPTSSSVTTCYSSSTFNESPNSSPLLHHQTQQHHNQLPRSSQEQQVSLTSSSMYYAANQQTAMQQPAHYQNVMHESIEHQQQQQQQQQGLTSAAISSLANSAYHQSGSENLSIGISKPSSAFFYYNNRADMAELQANKTESSEFVNYSSAQAQSDLSDQRSHFHQSQQQQQNVAQVAEQVAAPLMAYSSHSLQAR